MNVTVQRQSIWPEKLLLQILLDTVMAVNISGKCTAQSMGKKVSACQDKDD